MRMKKRTVQYTLPEDRAVLEAARKKAKANGSELSVVIRQILRDYISGRPSVVEKGGVPRRRNPNAPAHTNLMELKGLGKEIWDQEDAQEYVHRLRGEWAR